MTKLPRTVTVCGVRCELYWRSMYEGDAIVEQPAYRGAPDAHTGVGVVVSAVGRWAGEWYVHRARGTRGSLSVTTSGNYTDPRRCAEALTRLVNGWGVARTS